VGSLKSLDKLYFLHVIQPITQQGLARQQLLLIDQLITLQDPALRQLPRPVTTAKAGTVCTFTCKM
jgi:hypothetical protein